MIRVLLVDDHVMVRAGLVKLIESAADLEVVGVAGDGAEAVTTSARVRPDVVLMDLSMPRLDGIQATRLIVADHSAGAVVVLTSLSDRDRILAAMDAGAVGYLLKDAEPADLIRGVRAAARGEVPLDPRAAQLYLTGTGQHRLASVDLTPREREVLVLVGEGLANKLISRRLGITEKTVKGHLTSVFQAIGVTDRTQAALWATRQGIR